MKRRICIYCEIWESGGIESVIHNLLCAMDLSRIEVDIVAAKMGESVFTRPLQELGVRFYALSGSTRRLAKNYRLFKRLLAERRYDLIHLNAYQSLSFYYLHLAKKAGVPKRIAHSHSTGLRWSLTRPLKLFIHRCARALYTRDVTDLWACTGAAAAFLFEKKALAAKGFRFIPNGVDLGRFRYDADVRERVRREYGWEEKLVVAHVGRLCQQKNQEYLLDVFAEIVREKPESILLLIGKDEDRRVFLEKKAESLGIRSKVVFFGVCSRMREMYQAMDVFVFPSRFEGLGLAPIEAQAAGLPIICSDGITTEVKITADACFISLDEGPERWAEIVLAAAEEPRHAARWCEPRIDFDVKGVAAFLEHIYLTGEEG